MKPTLEWESRRYGHKWNGDVTDMPSAFAADSIYVIEETNIRDLPGGAYQATYQAGIYVDMDDVCPQPIGRPVSTLKKAMQAAEQHWQKVQS